MKPIPTDNAARAQEAITLLDAIKSKLAAGASFSSATESDFFVSMRTVTASYGVRTLVSPRRLKWIRDIDRKMKGKKK